MRFALIEEKQLGRLPIVREGTPFNERPLRAANAPDPALAAPGGISPRGASRSPRLSPPPPPLQRAPRQCNDKDGWRHPPPARALGGRGSTRDRPDPKTDEA